MKNREDWERSGLYFHRALKALPSDAALWKDSGGHFTFVEQVQTEPHSPSQVIE